MRNASIPHPSPALIVATIALILALGGTGYAALYLPGNVVGTRQLKKGAVTTKKIKNGAVTGAKIANNTIAGGKIQLGTLGTVPSATTAATATKAATASTATTATKANGLDGVKIVAGPTLAASNDSQVQGTATCPTGMEAISGNAVINTGVPGAAIESVAIQSTGAGTDNQVSVEIANQTGDPTNFNAYAVCINGSVSGADQREAR